MQEVLIPHPPLRLPSHLTLLPLLPPLRRQRRPSAEVLSQVLSDEPTLREDDIWAAAWGLDADHGGLAEGVDGF